MEHDGAYDDENTNGLSTDVASYRLLGESGLVEDDEGNVFSASEIDDSGGPVGSATPRDASASLGKSSFVSSLDDKANPAYWYYYYDPRYCGPSREAYMEEMALTYPEYRFDKHKGYGTALHYELLDRYGPSPLHRLTFLKKWEEKK